MCYPENGTMPPPRRSGAMQVPADAQFPVDPTPGASFFQFVSPASITQGEWLNLNALVTNLIDEVEYLRGLLTEGTDDATQASS